MSARGERIAWKHASNRILSRSTLGTFQDSAYGDITCPKQGRSLRIGASRGGRTRKVRVGRKVLAWWHAATADEGGATLVEYAFLIALIALIAFAAVEFLGEAVDTEFSDFNSEYEGARGA